MNLSGKALTSTPTHNKGRQVAIVRKAGWEWDADTGQEVFLSRGAFEMPEADAQAGGQRQIATRALHFGASALVALMRLMGLTRWLADLECARQGHAKLIRAFGPGRLPYDECSRCGRFVDSPLLHGNE